GLDGRNHLVSIEVGSEILAAEDARGDLSLARQQRAAFVGVRASDNGCHIGGQGRGRLEGPAVYGVVDAADAGGGASHTLRASTRVVGDDVPACRGGHGDRERAADVGLVKAWEGCARVDCRELAVEIDLAVFGVDETVNALAVHAVREGGVDLNLVVGAQVLKSDTARRDDAAGVEFGAVE